MVKEFESKVAFVTGASSGIGKATALAFARAGAAVVVADVQQKQGKAVAEQIKKHGGKALFVYCDVSKASYVEAAVAGAVKQYGKLNFAFNNAGIEGTSATTENYSEKDWDRVLAINLKGVWLCMREQIRQMAKQGSGAIVNNSSIAGLIGFPGACAYVASKHGIVGLTKTAALENAKKGIRVNAVCPGVIETPMITRYSHGDSKLEAALSAGEPVGRMGKPHEIADAVLWLCSSKSSFVTGQAIAVDGGWTSQ